MQMKSEQNISTLSNISNTFHSIFDVIYLHFNLLKVLVHQKKTDFKTEMQKGRLQVSKSLKGRMMLQLKRQTYSNRSHASSSSFKLPGLPLTFTI